jgi:hypothetical protein
MSDMLKAYRDWFHTRPIIILIGFDYVNFDS